MKKIVIVFILLIILGIAINTKKEDAKSVLQIEHNPFDYYIIEFNNKVNLNNFKTIIKDLESSEIRIIYYDNNKTYNYDNYENFIRHISDNLSTEENTKYTLYGVNINKILVYTTKYNYQKLSFVISNL